ncbi:MAG: hypothetical protein NTX08_02630 [Sphingobacteriales bacterium]|nr:hypothetical protein [Sphingobacteriales bacterium]
MNKHIIIFSLFLSAISCEAQNEVQKRKIDSLAYLSRAKADAILGTFDKIKTAKVLFSISDEFYFVILKESNHFEEYYFHTDSVGDIKVKHNSRTPKKYHKLLIKAFNFCNYKNDFVTRVLNPKESNVNLSYFVLKDEDGRRFGEYSLLVITVPYPIDIQFHSYLLKSLLSEYSNEAKNQIKPN